MTINVRQVGDVTLLDLAGPFKMGEAEDAFQSQVNDLLRAGQRKLGVNLAGVPEMDSSGIGSLVRAYSAAKQAGGRCIPYSPTRRIRQTLKMVRLDTVLELAEDEEAALASF